MKSKALSFASLACCLLLLQASQARQQDSLAPQLAESMVTPERWSEPNQPPATQQKPRLQISAFRLDYPDLCNFGDYPRQWPKAWKEDDDTMSKKLKVVSGCKVDSHPIAIVVHFENQGDADVEVPFEGVQSVTISERQGKIRVPAYMFYYRFLARGMRDRSHPDGMFVHMLVTTDETVTPVVSAGQCEMVFLFPPLAATADTLTFGKQPPVPLAETPLKVEIKTPTQD